MNTSADAPGALSAAMATCLRNQVSGLGDDSVGESRVLHLNRTEHHLFTLVDVSEPPVVTTRRLQCRADPSKRVHVHQRQHT